MKSLSLTLAALVLFAPAASRAQAKADAHAGHDHSKDSRAAPGAGSHDGHDHSPGSAGIPGVDLNIGAQKHEPTPEEKARTAAGKAITDARLGRLAAMWREVARGADEQAALKKSGLAPADFQKLQPVTGPYYKARLTAQRNERELTEVRKRVADAKAAGKTPAPADLEQEKVLARRSVEHETFRRRARDTIGAEAVKLLEKHEPSILGSMREAEERSARELAEQRAVAAKAASEPKVVKLIAYLAETSRPASPKVRAAALKKSGLDAKEAAGLSSLAQEFFGYKHAADIDARQLEDAKKRLEDAKAKKKKSLDFEEKLVAHYSASAQRFSAFRAEFAKKWGAELVAAFEKHAAEFEAVYATPSQHAEAE